MASPATRVREKGENVRVVVSKTSIPVPVAT